MLGLIVLVPDHRFSFYIGVGRSRKFGGGQGLEYCGSQGGEASSQQAHDVVLTSMRRNNIISTSCAH